MSGSEPDNVEDLLKSIVGHDMRNTLTTIFTCVGVLNRMGGLDQYRQRCLELITNSSEQMKRLLTELHDLLMATSSGIPLRPAPAHLAAVCQLVVQHAASEYPGRVVSCHAAGDGIGEWDAVRLTQTIDNLVSNALRYSEPDSAVELRWNGTDPLNVSIEIESQGPTIPAEVLPDLLRPSRRGRRCSAEREGLGLGIFFAAHIAEQHGGSLDVVSEGRRTVCRIALPRRSEQSI